jgi:hypothetical protein
MRCAAKLISLNALLSWFAWSQGCSDWREALLASFLPQKPDVAWLSRALEQSPEQWRSWRVQQEIRVLGQSGLARTADHPALPALRARLRRFYEAGAELYRLRLDPEKVFVSRGPQRQRLCHGQPYCEVRAIFSWQRDGPSLDFILAHEARVT